VTAWGGENHSLAALDERHYDATSAVTHRKQRPLNAKHQNYLQAPMVVK